MSLDSSNNKEIRPPWPWIKCVRDLTDPLLNPTHATVAVELPVELLPWLFLSDRPSALRRSKLKQLKITHILSVHAASPREIEYQQEQLEGTGIIQKRVHCDDSEGYDMIGQHWETCREFLQQVKETPDGRVIVHCVAGINRSGLIACAAHMVFERTPLVDVVRHCVERRGTVLWNRSFQRQLCDLAQNEGLLGPHPGKEYDDEPIQEKLPPPPPAHQIIVGTTKAKFRLAHHLANKRPVFAPNSNSAKEDNTNG